MLRAATRVIAVSEFTRRELIEPLSGAARRRSASCRTRSRTSSRRTARAPTGDYVLAVGTLEPRKNLARIAAAVDGELRVVGARGWGGVDPPPNVTWLGDVPDDELAALYRGARCLVYASLYEGFGIPVAEALACGCADRHEPRLGDGGARRAATRSTSTRPTSRRFATGSSGRRRPSPRRIADWAEVAAATRDVYEELA